MPKFAFIFIIILSLIFQNTEQYVKKCDQLGINFYEQLGCKIMKTDNDCPASYKCPEYKIANSENCMVGGKLIPNGESVEGTSNCLFCHCAGQIYPSSEMQFPCAMPMCIYLDLGKGCYPKMELDTCCPSAEYCPDSSTEICMVDGVNYTEHMKIQPADTCLECVCKKGFKLHEKPFCRRQPCNLEVYHYEYLAKDCTPFYNSAKALCCPSGFICSDTVKRVCNEVTSSPSSGINCNFRGKAYPYDSKFTVEFTYKGNDYKANCECKVAPHPTCVIE